MPTYSIKAPNGKTYRIDGPAGASDTDVQAEVARQYPEAVASEPKPTLASTIGRAAVNLPGDTMDTLKGLAALPGQAVNAVMHPVQTAQAVGGLASDAAHILTGGLQHVRELSAPEFQGSAPKMDTTAYDKFAGDVYDKYGTKENIYKTIGDHPLAPVITAASLALPALKATGIAEKIGTALEAAKGVTAAKTGEASTLKTVTQAGRRANAASGQMRNEITSQVSAEQAAQDAAAQAATERATRATALAQQARTQGKALAERKAAASAASVPPTPEIGTPAHLSDLGESIRTPALERQGQISADMRAADDKYRSAMDQVAAERAAKGVGVSDSLIARNVIKRSAAIVEPDPVKRAVVGSVPADSAGAKLHSMALDVLRPKEVPLTVNEAKAAQKLGIEVKAKPDGSQYRVVKPDLKAVDDFRRFLGKVLDGKIEGYEAINRAEAGQLYGDVSKVIDKYASGASQPVQANWAAGKKALEPFESVKAGRAVVGVQPGTSVSSVPASSIPGQIVSGGRDVARQVASVAGKEPVSGLVRSQVQNALTGAKSADAAEALVRPGTKLGDLVSAEPDLQAAVKDYLARARAAEQSGTQAKALDSRVTTTTGRAKVLDKAATGAQGDAVKATLASRQSAQELASLNVAHPREVGKRYIDMLNRAHASGTITTAQLQDGLKLATTAEKDFALEAKRNAWMKKAAIAMGLAPLGAGAVSVLHSGGN